MGLKEATGYFSESQISGRVIEMGLGTFLRSVAYGRPNPHVIATRWYWMDHFYWYMLHERLSATGTTLPTFTLSMSQEDVVNTLLVNEAIREGLPEFGRIMPQRDELGKPRMIEHFGRWKVVLPFYTANVWKEEKGEDAINLKVMMAVNLHVASEFTGCMKGIKAALDNCGTPLPSESHLWSQYKKNDHAIFFDMATYYLMQVEAYPEFSSFRSHGVREKIRLGLESHLFVRDPDVATKRLRAGEKGHLVPIGAGVALSKNLIEGR